MALFHVTPIQQLAGIFIFLATALSAEVTAECVDPNTCFGTGALTNSTGSPNVAIGFNALFSNTVGFSNTAVGALALQDNTVGSDNTATGGGALRHNTTGHNNTATGHAALLQNTTGQDNSAMGNTALFINTSGSFNTAIGSNALAVSTTASYNTATGYEALGGNDTGQYNTATGYEALENSNGDFNTAIGALALNTNGMGYANTASGYRALEKNTDGFHNTATGHQALNRNTTGDSNTANGFQALFNNTAGIQNTAFGRKSLVRVTTGFRNVALGHEAGLVVTSGSDNIIIGASNPGQAADNGVIRIGASAYQKRAFIAGIRGVKTGSTNASAVFIDVNGQMGTIKSAGRYKEDIQPMASVSERLFALHPVTFRYKQAYDDGSKPVQFGLIAEEVAEVFPELVVYDEQGKPETVSYHLLATLLLNEFQKEHSATLDQANRIAALEQQSIELAQLKKQVAMMAEVIDKLDHSQMVATTR